MVKVSTKFDKTIMDAATKHKKRSYILIASITISIMLSFCAVVGALSIDNIIYKIMIPVLFGVLIVIMWMAVPFEIIKDRTKITKSTAIYRSLDEDDVCNFTLDDERLIVEYICEEEVIRCDRIEYVYINKVEETPDFYFIKTETATYIMDKKRIEGDEDYAEVNRLLHHANGYKVCKR